MGPVESESYPNKNDVLAKLAYNSESLSNGCIIWLGKRTHNGYGEIHLKVNDKYRLFRTNRVVCWIKNEAHFDLYSKLQALHTCDNRACINENHIYPGTPAQNVSDREARYYGKVTI